MKLDLVRLAAVFTVLATAADAQLGGGWVAYSPQQKVHLAEKAPATPE